MRPIHIIGVPLDLGGGRRGVDMGPSAFRIAGLGEQIAALGYPVVDKGDLPAPIPETQEPRDEQQEVHPRHRQGLPEAVSDGARVARRGRDAARARRRSQPRRRIGRRPRPTGRSGRSELPIGLLWVDAHGDMNTPATSPSGNVHGMPLAALLGPEPAELAQIGGMLAEGAAGAHRAHRHPQPRRAREGGGPRLAASTSSR